MYVIKVTLLGYTCRLFSYIFIVVTRIIITKYDVMQQVLDIGPCSLTIDLNSQ